MPRLASAAVLLAVAAAVLVGCGSSGSGDAAAYDRLTSAAAALAGGGAKDALALEDCMNTASASGDVACAKRFLQQLAQRFAPAQAAADALEQATGSECRARIEKAVSDAALLRGDPSAPITTQAGADALTTQITDALQQFAQEIAQARAACT